MLKNSQVSKWANTEQKFHFPQTIVYYEKVEPNIIICHNFKYLIESVIWFQSKLKKPLKLNACLMFTSTVIWLLCPKSFWRL